jgi:hypothetical protein
MKLILFNLISVLFFISVNGQTNQNNDDKSVTLTVVGQGKTLEDATKIALRSAIEQAFGAFISSNTEILNDSLVKDEIVTVSNGSIKEFTILNHSYLPDGSFGVTTKAVVSINKLTSYCQSKGSVVEFSGGLFAMNLALQELNERNEIISWQNTQSILEKLLDNCYDLNINVSEPSIYENDLWKIPCAISVSLNKNYDEVLKYINSYISAVSLDSSEVENYKKIGKKTFSINFGGNKYFMRNSRIIKFIYNIPYIAVVKSIESINVSNSIDTFSIFDITKKSLINVNISVNPLVKINNSYFGIYRHLENGGQLDNVYLVDHPPSKGMHNPPYKFYLNQHFNSWQFGGEGYATFDVKEKKISITTDFGYFGWNIDDELIYNFNGHKKLLDISYLDYLTIDQIKKIKLYSVEKSINSSIVYFTDNEDPFNKPILSIEHSILKSSDRWQSESILYDVKPIDFKNSSSCNIVEIGQKSGENFTLKEAEIIFSGDGFPQTITKKIIKNDFSSLKSEIDKCIDGTIVVFQNIIVSDSHNNYRYLDPVKFNLKNNLTEGNEAAK